MSRIRATDTKPEMIVRSILHRMGYRFRTHRKDLPGKPDIVLSKYNTIVFVHGCFWHQHKGCIESSLPKSNTDYWRAKLKRNVDRDKRNKRLLLEKGWRVLRYWECEVESDPFAVARHITRQLNGPSGNKRLSKIPSKKDILKASEIQFRSPQNSK